MSVLFTHGRPHVVVVGLMGVGKSTTAKAVAHDAGVPVYDSDADIETLFGTTGGELAAEHGIEELHRIESAVLFGRLASEQPSVISAAASIVDDARCRDALRRRAHVVVLNAPVDEILHRIATGTHRRPIDRVELTALAERRAPVFAVIADVTLDATLPTNELVAVVLPNPEQNI